MLLPQEHGGELFLSPHVKLSGFNAMAHIESELIAQRFAEICTPRLQKRYGNSIKLEVREFGTKSDQYILEKIKRDTDVIRKRIKSGNLAPNKKP
jgi:hypothetical protein